MRKRHDAVLIAAGAYKSRALTLPGVGVKGVVQALDFLITSNKVGFGDKIAAYDDGTLNAKGKNVVVIGGGDTAMDCVRTAVRQGAKSVKCLYRRDRANMPGSQREVSNAEEEGVEFVWMASPEAVLGDGTVSGVRAQRMHLSVADSTGRQSPVPIEGSSFTLPAELVITALGFDPEDIPSKFGAAGLGRDQMGHTDGGRSHQDHDQLGRRLCRWRYRARAILGGLGHPRRPGIWPRRNRPLHPFQENRPGRRVGLGEKG